MPKKKKGGACERCGVEVPRGEGVRRIVNRMLPYAGRFAPSVEVVERFLCAECDRQYRRFPIGLFAIVLGIVVGLGVVALLRSG